VILRRSKCGSLVKLGLTDPRCVGSIPTCGIWNNFKFRYPLSSELDYTEDGKAPESWRKTPILSEKLDIETAKLLEQSLAIGIIL
jgi:hypothetical protein